MKEMNLRVQEREKEIIQIAQSINELAEIFKELSILVIEQVRDRCGCRQPGGGVPRCC